MKIKLQIAHAENLSVFYLEFANVPFELKCGIVLVMEPEMHRPCRILLGVSLICIMMFIILESTTCIKSFHGENIVLICEICSHCRVLTRLSTGVVAPPFAWLAPPFQL